MKLLLKIFFLVSLVSVIFLSLFVQYVDILNNKKQTTRLDKKISIYDSNYKNIIEKLLFDFNKEMIEITIDSLVLDPEVLNVELVDYSGEINVKISNKDNSLEVYKESKIILEVEGTKLGELLISYSKEQIKNQTSDFIDQIIQTTILLTVLLILILYILIYYFLKRLKVLALAAEEISSGNLNYEVNIQSNDEIGQLANKFEEMRKKLKNRIDLFNEQLQFRQLLINAVNIPIYIKDEKLEFITCNNAYLDLIGFHNQEADSFSDTDLNKEFEILEKEVLKINKDISKNLTVKNAKEETIDIILTNNLFYDKENKLAGIVGSIFDITQINEAKRRIEGFNVELQAQVEEQTKELVSSNQELEKSIEELKLTQNELIEAEKMASLGGLVAGVAHEINTPIGIGLTGITHFDDILTDTEKKYHSGEITEEEFEEFLSSSKTLSNLIKINLSRTAQLVKSFKQISVDQSSEQIREFNFKKYLEEIVTSLNAEIKKTELKVEINCADDINIRSYPGDYSQIITNFILNSKIHAYDEIKKGVLKIDITKRENEIEIIYSDDGKGIEEENLAKIFDPFFTTNRGNGGSGLGLNIIYNLVTNKLKGSIDCESKVGEGVTFKLNIPLEN